MEDVEPLVSYEHVELNIDAEHLVILYVATIKHCRMLQTTIVRRKSIKADSSLEDDIKPLPEVCKKVFHFLQKELKVFSQKDARGLEVRMYIPCASGTNIQNAHMHVISKFDKDVLPCGSNQMEVKLYRKLFGEAVLPKETLKSQDETIPSRSHNEGYVDDQIIRKVSEEIHNWKLFGVHLGLSSLTVTKFGSELITSTKEMMNFWRTNIDIQWNQLEVFCIALIQHGSNNLADMFQKDIVEKRYEIQLAGSSHKSTEKQRKPFTFFASEPDQIVELIVDSKGETLYLKDKDTKLVINPGAIEEGKNVKVSLENTSFPSDLLSDSLETILSPVVRCGPPGTVFRNHCLLSFPHNAVDEECWEFTLLVTTCHGEWRRIKLDSNEDDDITFSLNNGQCCVHSKHFSKYGLTGRPTITNRGPCKKTARLGVFGKVLINKYQLRVRTWDTDREKEVFRESHLFGEIPIQIPKYIDLLHTDMDIEVENKEDWDVKPPTQTITANEIWKVESWSMFIVTRKNKKRNRKNKKRNRKNKKKKKQEFSTKILTLQKPNERHELPFVWDLQQSRSSGLGKQDVSPPGPLESRQSIREDSPQEKTQEQVNFKIIKVKFSQWYDRRHLLNKLKILYKDLLSNGQLDKASNTNQLLNFLMEREHLTSHDLTLFYETIKATEQFGLASKIYEEIGTNQNVRKIPILKFTPHRLMLIQFGEELTEKDIRKINDFYNDAEQVYDDQWHLIMDLEMRNIICEGNMQSFIKHLNRMELKGPMQVLKVQNKSAILPSEVPGNSSFNGDNLIGGELEKSRSSSLDKRSRRKRSKNKRSKSKRSKRKPSRNHEAEPSRNAAESKRSKSKRSRRKRSRSHEPEPSRNAAESMFYFNKVEDKVSIEDKSGKGSDKVYVGETKRTLRERIEEHIAITPSNQSALAEHFKITGHELDKSNVKVLCREDKLIPRKIWEAIYTLRENPVQP
ncbi:uncharacterized protein [Antedon mediterranea]|uniref:uncharacterized protein n=1 Tax=Antedon mediterranea TaxID=105859 RepID=UPI003AF733A3